MDSVSSTLSSESSVSFSESDTDAESIQSLALFQLAHSLPDDIATAAAEGDLTVVRRWLEAGWYGDDSLGDEDEDERLRDVNAMDENGWTLLLHACTGPYFDQESYSGDDEAYVDLVRYLITQGANVRHVADEDGSTAMSVACSRGVCAEIVAELLSAGASAHERQWLVARGRATTADTLDFSAASAFYGSRKGYVFKTGDQGLGYYLDDVEKAKERVLEGLEVLGRVAGLPNELRSKVLGYWCLAE